MTKLMREKTQISKTRNEKGDKTTNTNEIQRIIREYFENLYSSKLENLDEIDKFLDAYNQPKWSQEDINYLSSPITYNEIKAVIVSLQRRVQDLMDS
jgi:transcription termination factor NusB